MNKQPFIISELLIKKLRQSLTEEEEIILENWAAADPKNRELMDSLLSKASQGIDLEVFEKFDEEAAFQRLIQKEGKGTGKGIYIKFAYIAAAILMITGFSFLFFRKADQKSSDPRFVEVSDKRYQNDVLPAEVGAYIFRENMESVEVREDIVLMGDGKIASKDGDLVLDEALPNVMNSLVVPAAHFFALSLSDGTKVWVNANSELKFPSQFASEERRVELKGEAYFEVAKDANRPFYVESNGTQIKVLGTHFNVHSYSNDLKATLLEGRIAVSKDENERVLTPGQQVRVVNSKMTTSKADVQKDIAWKNNVFLFSSDNIISIAQQLKNWYDLDISFADDISMVQTYTGEINRDAKLSEVLNMLEYVSDLDFKIDQNKLLILNKKKI